MIGDVQRRFRFQVDVNSKRSTRHSDISGLVCSGVAVRPNPESFSQAGIRIAGLVNNGYPSIHFQDREEGI